MEHEKLIKDAQYRKGLSIAFFNATNAAIELVKGNPKLTTFEKSDVLETVKEIRDFFLKEHQNYYATVIAKIGSNYKADETIKKLRATKNIAELRTAWQLLSEDERQDEEIKKVALELKTAYEKA